MATGVCKWYSKEKGYGFISPDGGSKDVFVRVTALERSGLKTLTEGQRVSFEIETDKKNPNKSHAANLRAL